MVAKPLCPLYKNIIKHLDRARYPELRYKLICANTVDERANTALSGKQGVQQSLLDGLNYLVRKYHTTITIKDEY